MALLLKGTYIPLWYHKQNLMQTATGYGSKLKTPFKVYYEGRMRRVYCRIFSNIGTTFIILNKKEVIVDLDNDQ